MQEVKNKFRKYRKSIDTLILVILSLLLLYNITTVRKGEGNVFKYSIATVVTGSMVPTIEINSLNILKYCDMEDVEVGDIIAFKWNDMLITHRIIDQVEENGDIGFVTKGDANEVEDGIVITRDMFRGEIVKTYNSAAPIMSFFVKDDGSYDINMPLLMVVLLIISYIIDNIFLRIKDLIRFIRYIYIASDEERYCKELALILCEIDEYVNEVIRRNTGDKSSLGIEESTLLERATTLYRLNNVCREMGYIVCLKEKEKS